MKYCFLFVLLLLTSTASFGQIYIEQSGADLTEIDVTEYDMDLIMKTTSETLTKYSETATFLSPTGQFSEEKYADFLGLFSGGAKVFNDLAEKDGDNIDYAVYADNIYQFMQGTGVKFELNDVYLEKMKYDSGGFYIVTLSMEKLMLNGLNDNNVTTNYNNGVPVPLEMKIEMPDYDITQATIISILGEGAKKKVERSSMITLDGIYYLGTVLKQQNNTYSGFDGSFDYPIGYNAYGVESIFKLSLNQSKTLWAIIGAQVNFHNFNVNLGGFNGESSFESGLQYDKGGKHFYENGSVDQGLQSETYTLLTVDEGSEFSESMTAIAVEVPLGISLNLKTTYDYDFFIDFAVVPGYIISGSGSFSSNNLRYFNIPVDTSIFPQDLVDYVVENEVEPFYNVDDNFDKATTISNNFTLGAMIAPNFHYKFNYRMALEIGANIQYNFLPFFKAGHKDGKEGQELVRYLSDEESVYTSTIQHYFTNVNVLRYGLKVGIVFKL